MAKAETKCVRPTRYEGLRCHICGLPIPIGEDHDYKWDLGAVHVDRTKCEKRLKEFDEMRT
jgi:hypothetical protein